MANIDKEKLYTIRWHVNKLIPDGEDKSEILRLLSDLLGEKEKAPTNERETLDPDDKKKIKLAIIVGHEKRAGGADFAISSAYKDEYSYNTAIANLCNTFISSGAYSNIQLKIIFRDGIGISGAYNVAKEWGCDCCIELHYNAYNTKASGSETLTTVDAQDKLFAQIIHNEICLALSRGGQSRVLKILSRGDRGGGNIYAMPGSANCLVEPFFGDNPTEAKLALDRMDQYAKCLLDGCVKWAKSQSILT